MFEKKVTVEQMNEYAKMIGTKLESERKRTNNLVRVLIQVLDKKTMSKNIVILGDFAIEMTVASALKYIDP
jgi:hypothetical protein